MASPASLDEADPTAQPRITLLLFALVAVALAAGAYFVVRVGGRWAESDTALMTGVIRSVVEGGRLIPETGPTYSSGYGYQAVSSIVMAWTGLSVQALQQIVYPLVSAGIVLTAWALYRELTGSTRVALLAALFLLLVPEHLFTMLRGSHERIDRALLLAILWMMVRAWRFRSDPARFAIHVALVFAMMFGLIATNGIFGMSFVAAMATAAVGALLVGRLRPDLRAMTAGLPGYLGWLTAGGIVLFAIFFLFLWPPFDQSLHGLAEVPRKLISLLLNAQESVDPYGSALTGWVSPAAFLLLSLGNVLLLGGSAVAWLAMGWLWWRGRGPASTGLLVLWLFYVAFGLQGVISIFSDRTGVLGGHFQYRSFAIFSVVAAPLLAYALSRLRLPMWSGVVVGASLAFLATVAVLKASNEPALSNKWTFYSDAELSALGWANAYQRSTDTWVGPDERLMAAYEVAIGAPTGANAWDAFEPKPTTRAFLISDIIRAQSARLGEPLPPLGAMNLIYDNGSTQVLRERPSGEFERGD